MEIKEKLQDIAKSFRASTSFRYRIFIVSFVFLLLIFCTSSFYLPKISNIAASKIGEEQKFENTTLTLKSFTYNPENGLLETVLGLENSSSNYHQEFIANAVTENNKKLNSEVIYSSSEMLVVNINDVSKKDLTAIKLTIQISNSEESNPKSVSFVCTSENVAQDKSLTVEKQNSNFENQALKLQIDDTKAEIEALNAENDAKNKEIEDLRKDIKELKRKLKYQTRDEKKENYSTQSAKEILIEKAKKEIADNQLKIEAYERKIKKYEEQTE